MTLTKLTTIISFLFSHVIQTGNHSSSHRSKSTSGFLRLQDREMCALNRLAQPSSNSAHSTNRIKEISWFNYQKSSTQYMKSYQQHTVGVYNVFCIFRCLRLQTTRTAMHTAPGRLFCPLSPTMYKKADRRWQSCIAQGYWHGHQKKLRWFSPSDPFEFVAMKMLGLFID